MNVYAFLGISLKGVFYVQNGFSLGKEAPQLEERVAIIGIFIQHSEAAVKVNEILHSYADQIVGRMGIPYREKSINIISVIVSASANDISSLAGKLGRIDGITVKSMQTELSA